MPTMTPTQRDEALDWLTAQLEKAKVKPFCEMVTLSPALADVILTLNPGNRRVKKGRLIQLEADINSGNFALNGESIILSVDGLLNDGQHRLMATVNTGKSIDTVLCFGVSRESRLTVDTGAVKDVSDFLSMNGIEKSRQAGIVARLLLQYEKYGTVTETQNTPMFPTKVQIQEAFYAKRSEIENALHIIPSKGSQMFGSASVLAFMYVLFARRDHVAAREFIGLLTTGAGLPEGHPILVCRNRFLLDKKNLKHLVARCEILIRTWNMWRSNSVKVKQIPIMGKLPDVQR